MLTIINVKGIPKQSTHEVFCTFTFMDEKETATEAISGQCYPAFNFTKHIAIPKVDQQFLDYVEDGALTIDVWAKTMPVAAAKTAGMSTAELINQFRLDGGERGHQNNLRRLSKSVAMMPFGSMRGGLGATGSAPPLPELTEGGKVAGSGEGTAGAVCDVTRDAPTGIREPPSAEEVAAVQRLKSQSKVQQARSARAKATLGRIERLLAKAAENDLPGISVRELRAAMHPNKALRQFKGLAQTVLLMNRAKRWTSALVGAAAAIDTAAGTAVDGSGDCGAVAGAKAVSAAASADNESESKACSVM